MGITLVVLVVTIVILLILAGISIAMLTGQNGILTQAQNSKTVTENKSAEEIFLMEANHTIEMYITASSATDIYYLIRKHLHNIEAAKMIMGKLYSLTGILEVTADDCMDEYGHRHNNGGCGCC